MPRSTSRLPPTSMDQLGIVWVLKAMLKQAEMDARVEDTKTIDFPLEASFQALDRFGKGYITDIDIWTFCEQGDSQIAFANLCGLIHEVQLRRPRHLSLLPGRLSFRELSTVLLKEGTQEHRLMSAAATDSEAYSIAYILRNSEPCPGCRARIQRDANAAGCPSVTCPICNTSFRCFMVADDSPQTTPLLHASVQYQLCRLLETAAKAAQQLESTRQQVSRILTRDRTCSLSKVFGHIAEGRLSLSMNDLHRAFLDHDISPSARELSLLCCRYGGAELTFAEVVRQLSPR